MVLVNWIHFNILFNIIVNCPKTRNSIKIKFNILFISFILKKLLHRLQFKIERVYFINMEQIS